MKQHPDTHLIVRVETWMSKGDSPELRGRVYAAPVSDNPRDENIFERPLELSISREIAEELKNAQTPCLANLSTKATSGTTKAGAPYAFMYVRNVDDIREVSAPAKPVRAAA